MKNYRKLFALLMTVVMLLGMVPAAHAELAGCNHDWDSGKWLRGEPTNCLDWKPKTYTCSICGATVTNEECGPCVPGNKTWVVPQASNCQEHGVWEITCKYCGEWLEGMEEPGPHKWSETIVEEPWCDVGGMKAMICSVCGEWQNNGTPLNPLGHNWGSWSWAHGSAPSCTEGAWQVRECQRCGQMEDRYVQGSNHKFGEWITTVEPTCTERGRHHHKCTVCGYSEWEPMPTVDHVFGDWRVIEEPQVGIPGTERRACIYGCGTHEDREIPPLEEALSADGLELTLVLSSTPANGQYFVLGEEVVFTETWVNNTGKELYPFYVSIWTYPTPVYEGVPDIMCSWDAEETGPVAPGATGSHQLVTTVTEADVARGAIHAMAIIISNDHASGAMLEDVTTPFVSAPCVPGELPMNSDGVRLEKELRNAPANGEFYVAGEVLNYALTLRLDDGLLLDDAAIYDPIAGGDGLVISYGKGLYGSMGMDVFYIVTLEDAQRGYVENTAYATWIYQDSGEAGGCESETVIAVCGMGELPEGYEPTGILQVETFETTTPVNGTHYVEGETVILADVFANRSANLTLTGSDWVNVEVLGKGIFNRNADFGADAVLAPGESKILLYSTYVITAEDVAQGYIQKTVHAGFADENDMFYTGSFEIRIPCGPAAEDDAPVDAEPIAVVKGILNTPANPEGFMFGEVIEFTVAVTNNLPDTVQHINIVDPLIPGWNYDIYALEPGATASTTVSYTVNIVDCFNGSVENYVSGRAVVADGYRFLKSNTVHADCMEVTILNAHPVEDPFGILFGLEVEKTVESLPLNGSYYTEGETVAYRITYVNGGEIPLTDVMIYDALAGIDEIAAAEKLEPGESRTCFFNYTVTAGDVARGYIANTAVGQYIVNGYLNAVYSDAVVVDTDGQPDPESPEGAIDAGKLNSPAYCFRSSSSRTNVAYSWGTSFCINHEGVQGNILMMEKAAATPEANLQAANYAVALWRAEVEKLYQELLGAADPQARAVIMAEYVAFLIHASNYETLLKVRCADQPALAAQKLADLWEEKCITLCFEMHAPVSARQDSFLSVEVATMEGISDACTCVTYVEDKGWNGIEQTYCPAHSFPFAMIDMLLNGQDTAEAWMTVRQIWQVELRGGYNKVITLLGDRSDVALAEYATLENWMIAREAELTLLYPDHPELVAQTMVRIIIDQVNALCQLAQ